MNKSIVVGIPIYKEKISELEKISLCQVDRILFAYKKVFIAPESLTFNYGYDYSIIRFSDEYFISTESYSELLMSQEFYQRFEDYHYLLIYQLDAFGFRDSLQEIYSWGYDYIGAPLRGRDWQLFHVGNGGLSLRNVKRCQEMVEQRQWIIKKILDIVKPIVLAEDIFFSYCGWDKEINFTVPSPRVAARFSVQTDYAKGIRGIKKNGLPLGCHCWWRLNYDFWKPYIESYGYELPELKMPDNTRINELRIFMYLARRKIRNLKQSGQFVKIKDVLPNKGYFSVYGAGVWGQRSLEFLKAMPLSIYAVFDKNLAGREIEGISIVKADKDEIQKKKSFIVISSLKYEREIKENLISAGLREGEEFCSIYDLCKAIKDIKTDLLQCVNFE